MATRKEWLEHGRQLQAENIRLLVALEKCAYETVRSPSYAGGGGPSYLRCQLCGAEQVKARPPDWRTTHEPGCELTSTTATERGESP